MSNIDTISKDNDNDSDDGPCMSLFQCCHPKGEGVDCWSAFKDLVFHQTGKDNGVHQAAKDNGVTPAAKEKESRSHKVALNTKATTAQESSASSQSDDTTTASTVIEPSVEQKPASTALTVGEKYHLSKILAYLADTTDDTQTPEERNECKDSSSPLSSPFLLQLATAAATVALESKINIQGDNEDSTSVSFDPNDDNPQAMIQLLLQEARRQEALQETEKQHLGRVKTISTQGSLPKLVLSLEAVLQTKSQFTTTIYFSIVTVLLGKCTPSTTLDFLWKALDSDNDDKKSTSTHEEKDKQKVYELMELCFHLALAHSFLTCPEDDKKRQIQLLIGLQQQSSSSDSKKDPPIQALHQSFLSFLDKQPQASPEESHKLFLDRFLEWHDRHVPSMLSTLSVCMREILFPSFSTGDDDDNEHGSSLLRNDGWAIPSLDRDEGSDNLLFSSSSTAALSSWQFIMACTMPPCQHGKVGAVWHRLYSTHSEGFNLSTLEHSLTGYHGPTLMLVEALDKQSQTNQTFGAFASQPWVKQEGPDFYGDSDSFLFQLGPNFKVARAETEQSQLYRTLPNYQYFYLDNSSLPTPLMKDDPKKHESGIGLGGSRRRPRFFVAASLDKCYLGDSDATFQDAKDDESIKMIHPFWDLHALEVWGLGGDAAMTSLLRHRSREEAQLQKARQVDKAAFLNDFRSGLIESKMFGFYDDIRNRDGGCLLDCHDEEGDGRREIGAPR